MWYVKSFTRDALQLVFILLEWCQNIISETKQRNWYFSEYGFSLSHIFSYKDRFYEKIGVMAADILRYSTQC